MIAAVVPVKRLDEAKGRLSVLLTPDERRRLALAMLEDVLRALQAVPRIDLVAVVSPDAGALARASALGAEPLAERPLVRGVNQALSQAARGLADQGASALVVVAAGILPARVLHAASLARDVDEPGDLAQLLGRPAETATHRLLAEIGIAERLAAPIASGPA